MALGGGVLQIGKRPGLAVSRAGLPFRSLPRPFYIPHRNAADIAPENSLEGIDLLVSNGVRLMEGADVWVTSDSKAAVMHDPTVDRTTTSTGNISALTLAQFMALDTDPSVWHAPGWANSHPPSFAQVCERARRFGLTIVPEIKTNLPSLRAAMLSDLAAYGLKHQVCIASGALAALADFTAAGFPVQFQTADAATSAATLTAAGVEYVGYDYTNAAVTDAYLTSLVAAGIKPIAYTVKRRVDRITQLARGAVGFYADAPLWLSEMQPHLSADTFATKKWAPGVFRCDSTAALGGYRGEFLGTDRWGIQTGDGHFTLHGSLWLPTSFTLNFRLTFDTRSGDTTRWGAIGFELPDDQLFNGQTTGNGYMLLFRANGQINLYKVVNGTYTQIGTVSSTAIPSDGASGVVQIQVTPTQIIVTRTDTGHTFTATDSTYRDNRYMAFGKLGAANKVSFSEVSIS